MRGHQSNGITQGKVRSTGIAWELIRAAVCLGILGLNPRTPKPAKPPIPTVSILTALTMETILVSHPLPG